MSCLKHCVQLPHPRNNTESLQWSHVFNILIHWFESLRYSNTVLSACRLVWQDQALKKLSLTKILHQPLNNNCCGRHITLSPKSVHVDYITLERPWHQTSHIIWFHLIVPYVDISHQSTCHVCRNKSPYCRKYELLILTAQYTGFQLFPGTAQNLELPLPHRD